MQLNPFADSAIVAIDQEIKSIISSEIGTTSPILYEVIRDHFGWNSSVQSNGKKMRPLVCIFTAQANWMDWKKALPAAAAIEIIHNYSLIHDDIEDLDKTRHKRPTAWVKFGVPQAINAGDALLAAGISAVFRLGKDFAEVQKTLVARKITEAVVTLTRGQSLDLEYSSKSSISIEDYEKMVAEKTAALIETAISIGAILAGFSQPEIIRLESYGHAVGMAFQIQDDFLGIWGASEKTGKSSSNDLLSHKQSLPVVIGIKQKKKFEKLWSKKQISQKTLKEAIQFLEDDGVKEIVVDLEKAWWQKASLAMNPMLNKYPRLALLVEYIESIKNRDR